MLMKLTPEMKNNLACEQKCFAVPALVDENKHYILMGDRV